MSKEVWEEMKQRTHLVVEGKAKLLNRPDENFRVERVTGCVTGSDQVWPVLVCQKWLDLKAWNFELCMTGHSRSQSVSQWPITICVMPKKRMVWPDLICQLFTVFGCQAITIFGCQAITLFIQFFLLFWPVSDGDYSLFRPGKYFPFGQVLWHQFLLYYR